MPALASPVDSDSYCGTKDSPGQQRQHQGGTILDAELVKGLGGVEPSSVGTLQFVGHSGIRGAAPRRWVFVERFDHIVDETSTGTCRIDLRDKMIAADGSDRAAGRERNRRHQRGLSASGTYLSASAAVISKGAGGSFLQLMCRVDDAAGREMRVMGMYSTVAPDWLYRSVR